MIIKKLDFNGAIKTLRELETIGTLPNHYRDGINYSVSNLNENILPQTSLKHKNHNNQNWDTCLQNTTIKSVLNNKRNN
ncbi:hypothetical protein [Helicobacter pylori]|uniref:hypothetical protein n=1 Tax=Helicobacter pylori TaxID=210 RepID=UPI001932A313|nr:hypothetical protein [Helicobacter pylori]MBM0603725.1 hypothetical protein [Helicobacter pylori]MBM0614303.1 hypothetical protein [Helicobacter pylori]MBM0615687.1 hypothetical protein [Helicobacter pylori]MBM0617032.1 hypothetical protein [Helicobacter pylori]MBM0628940.1 hypothetical protein [Helicobacter pylori]